jgi:hypothetical protein
LFAKFSARATVPQILQQLTQRAPGASAKETNSPKLLTLHVQPVRPDRRQDLPPQDVSYRMLDQQTLDGIAALVSELEVKKIELHSELGRR